MVVKRPADKWCEIIILQFINFPWKSLKIVKLRYSRDSDTNSYSMIIRSNCTKKVFLDHFSVYFKGQKVALLTFHLSSYLLKIMHSTAFLLLHLSNKNSLFYLLKNDSSIFLEHIVWKDWKKNLILQRCERSKLRLFVTHFLTLLNFLGSRLKKILPTKHNFFHFVFSIWKMFVCETLFLHFSTFLGHT